MEIVGETHTRTISKTIIYRLLTTISVMLITYFIFHDLTVVGGMGIMVVLLGSTLYYLHDRIWLFFKWKRDEDGKDNLVRSTIKTISYRLIVIAAIAITVKLLVPDSTGDQVSGFVLAQLIINILTYFLIERIFNHIKWGKIIETQTESTVTK